MRYHCQRWHSEVATDRDEVVAAVDIEGMRWEAADTGNAPLLEPRTHCREFVHTLQCCCLSVLLMRGIVRTEKARMVDSTDMERTPEVA